jgi:hypothetical protein
MPLAGHVMPFSRKVIQMSEPERIDIDIVLDIILDLLDIVWDREIVGVIVGERGEVGDLPPFNEEYLEVVIKNPEVREVVARRVREAQAEGRAFPLPSGPELAAARERQLARRRRS